LVLRTTAVAWAVAALVLGAPAIATAGAKRGGTDAGGCAGAYVIAKDAASLAKASAGVLCLVNAERTARGIPAVRASSKLAVAARGHSDDMVASKALTHSGSDGTDVYQRATSAGYRWRALAEAIAWGAARRAMPVRLVAQFMRSSEHRSILLDPVYRDLGVGLTLGAPTRKPVRGSSTLTLVFGSS
jgi:uncharacterized protein YkwD